MTRRQAIRDHGLERQILHGRLLVAAILMAMAVMVFIGRLYYLQVVDYEHFTTLSQNNRVRLEPLPPPRGMILDRQGVVLAENRPAFQLEIVREQVADLDETLERLVKILPVDESDLERFRREVRRTRPFQPIALRSSLTDEEIAVFSIDRHQFPGVEIQARSSRFYPLGPTTSHIVGYVGRVDERDLQTINARSYSGTTHIGKIGIERSYEDLLHGGVGYQQVEVNAQGRILRVLERESPVEGKDLVLSIDVGLQYAAIAALEGRNGAIVAIDPRNGEILALVSQPSFDGNLFVHGISKPAYAALREDATQPLFNRALSGQYPPGSTLKPVFGLAGLEYGITTASRTMFAGPYYRLPNDDRHYRDWKKQGHGVVDLDKAITQSVDVYFYDLAFKMGIDRMSEFLERFGLGSRTGVDTTGEATGLVPSREWKRRVHRMPWFPGETLSAGIGQGYMLTTPLQLASLTATMAKRGQRFRPKLLLNWRDVAGNRTTVESEPLPPVTIKDARYWDQVLEPMVHVMHQPNGTAYHSGGRTASYTIAGKTGTAQVFGLKQDEKYDAEAIAEHLRDHALFIGYAPAEDPQIAIAVIVENGGSGGRVAAPVARRVMDYHLLHEERTDAGGS